MKKPKLSHTRCLQLASFLLLASSVGCGHRLYYWGSYEPMVHSMYASPEKSDPPTQIAKLGAEVEKANAAGKKVAPGINAHLGYMYFQVGDRDAATKYLNAEKQLYPESTVMVDRMLAALNGGSLKDGAVAEADSSESGGTP